MKATDEVRQGGLAGSLGKSDLDRVAQVLESSFDKENGGFGNSQKFPNPMRSISFSLCM